MKTQIKPWKIDLNSYPEKFQDSIADFCGSLLSVVHGLESAMRQFHPPKLIELQKALRPFGDRLKIARRLFGLAVDEFGSDDVSDQLMKSAERAGWCLDHIMSIDRPQTALEKMLKAMRQHDRAQEYLYPLVIGLKPVGRYFLEPEVRDRLASFLPASENEFHTGLYQDSENGYCLYVPETYDGQHDWPLVVALHGGSGRGRDYIWLWLREARSRRFLLLAPSSAGRTWSFEGSEDADSITRMIDNLSEKWRVDRSRMLLTGFSDGAIYTLTYGMQENSPFSMLAPISGILHPVDLKYASRKKIYLVHGTLDWMFPVQHAHIAFARLKQTGAEIEFHEKPDLSHTYPREENDSILSWFDASLSLK